VIATDTILPPPHNPLSAVPQPQLPSFPCVCPRRLL
jgi:hypothetical protein